MNNKDYKVSIITVVYNGAKTIEQTIKSVLAQTYKNIEYIIIDGGSNDGTQQIVDKFRDSIACFVSEADDGIFDAMNKGIRKATGDIIGIINSDDWYADNAVENVVRCLIQKDVEVVYGKSVNVYSDGMQKMGIMEPLETIWYKMIIPHPTVFIKRSVYERFGTFCQQYRLGADYELLLRFYSQHVKFGYVDEIISYFRIGGRSMQGLDSLLEEHKSIALKYLNLCPEKEVVSEKLEKTYKWLFFSAWIRKGKLLPEILNRYFEIMPLHMGVFGTGIWGDRCYGLLKNSKMEIEFFVDNNSSKWNQTFHGIKIISPAELKNGKFNVLIAVEENWIEIKQQLERLGNKNLNCVSLKELAMLYYKDEGIEENA